MFRDTGRGLVGVTLLVAAVLAVAAANAPALAQTGPTVPFVTVAQGNASGVHDPVQLVIRDQAAWATLWGRHRGATRAPVPAVDFSHDMVVAIFADESGTPRQLKIRQITQEANRLEVSYTLAVMGPLPEGEGASRVVPFHIVRLARSTLPVRFVRVKTPQVY